MSQASPEPAAWKELVGVQAYLQQRPQRPDLQQEATAPTRSRAPIPDPSARVLGPSAPAPGSLGVGHPREPAMSPRNRQSPVGGVGVPVPLGLAALQHLHSRDQRSAGSSAPLRSVPCECHGLQPGRKEACAGGGGATSPRKPRGANDWQGTRGKGPALHPARATGQSAPLAARPSVGIANP